MRVSQRRLTPDQRDDLIREIRERYSTPEAREHLVQSGRDMLRSQGLTGNPQMDAYRRTAKQNEFWHNVGNLEFMTTPTYS